MENKDYLAGTKCTIDGDDDLYFLSEAREFINKECVIVKRTKSGLIQVCLKDDSEKTLCVPCKNVEFKNEN